MLLWADAICINQSDINERNTQVKLMGEIYRTATRVHVWLGLDSPKGHVEEAFLFVESLYNRVKDLNADDFTSDGELVEAWRSLVPF
jgi:hypothetical protein